VAAIFPHDGKGLAPVTLTAEEPVAELVGDRLFADAERFEARDDFGFRDGRGEAVERAAVDGETFASEAFERLGFAMIAPVP
jgi:hypothetical protein